MKKIIALVLAAASVHAHAQFSAGQVLTASGLNSALAAPTITGGTINGAPIGNGNPSSGSFTTLTSSGPATLNGVTLPSSATGAGSLVLSNAPTLVNPNLGTPSSISLANATNLAATAINYGAGLTPLSGIALPVSLFGESAGASYISGGGLTVADGSAHAGTGHFGYLFASRPIGTGASGPTNADYGFGVSLLKQGFNGGGALAGELDGGYIVVRNDGSNSDTTALLFDVGNYGTGFNAIYEGNSFGFSGNTIAQGVNNQAGVVDTRTGNQYGYVVQKNYGIGGVAYLANQGAGNSGQWQHLLQYTGSGGVRFDMPIDTSTNALRMRLFDGSLNAKTIRVNANKLSIMNSAETGEIMTVDDSGNIANSGGLSTGNVTANTLALGSPLPVSSGGTGTGALTQYQVLAGNGSTITAIAPGAAGAILGSNGASAFPTFQTKSALGVAASGGNSDITSLSGLTTALSVAQGGTGRQTLTSHGVLIGEGTAAINQVAAGTAGQVLTSGGSSADPAWGNPGQPYFQASRSATQSLTVGTATKVQFDTKVFDSGTYYDNTTNYRFTPLVAGKYWVHASVSFTETTTAASNLSAVVQLYKNGASYLSNRLDSYTGGATTSIIAPQISGIVTMNGSTDYLELWGTVQSASSASINGGTAPMPTWFEAQYIGP